MLYYIDAWVAAAMAKICPRHSSIHGSLSLETNSAHEWCYLCQGVAQLFSQLLLLIHTPLFPRTLQAFSSLSTFCIPSSRFHLPLSSSPIFTISTTLHSFSLVSAVELQLPIPPNSLFKILHPRLTHTGFAPRGESLGADTLFIKRHA
ncbi:hypothetical protein H0G86_001011 [Trichoderma simmonsii]|uniref:Uncharacterized protein n=1 Tax=Trichoderma simmonsii TaxID=1491479 RepID=A0A8G0L3U6_9HYPO|nr:hypothetical protein H0G86_001011 [Trichoderma simmonsii]